MFRPRRALRWFPFLLGLAIALAGILPAPAAATPYTEEGSVALTANQYVSVLGLAVGDSDDDGLNEIAAEYDYYGFSTPVTPRLVFYEWNGIQFTFDGAIDNVSFNTGKMADARQISIADVDGNGLAEVVFAGLVDGAWALYAYAWNGTGYERKGQGDSYARSVFVADADGDGAQEVVTAGSVFRWNGTGFAWVGGFSGAVGDGRFLWVADADLDPGTEVVLSAAGDGFLAYEWDGTEYAMEASTGGGVQMSAGLGVADFDSDGQNEVMVTSTDRTVDVYKWNVNTYDLVWQGLSTTDLVDYPGFSTVGDADNDRVPEILAAHVNHVGGYSVTVFKFSGGTYHMDFASVYLDGYVDILAVGDADTDGVNELVTGSGAIGTVRVLSAPVPPSSPPPALAVARVSTQAPFIGDTVFFNGSQSSGEGGVASYSWDFGDGARAATSTASHVYMSHGPFIANLTIVDGHGTSDSMTLPIVIENRWPVAVVAPDATVFKGANVTLDATGSYDPDGDPLAFHWEQTSGPSMTLFHAYTSNASFVANRSGTYVFQIWVFDGYAMVTRTSQVTCPDRVPAAEAGADRVGWKRTTVLLNASASTDPDADPLEFNWILIAGPSAANLSDGNRSVARFAAAVSGTYVLRLTVRDGDGGEGMDFVNVTIVNRLPTIDASSPTESVAIETNTTQDLSVSASDPDADILTYVWRVNGQVRYGNTSAIRFRPGVAGTYTLNVTVTDGEARVYREWIVTVTDAAAPPPPPTNPPEPAIPWTVWLAVAVVAAVGAATAALWTRRRRRKPPA